MISNIGSFLLVALNINLSLNFITLRKFSLIELLRNFVFERYFVLVDCFSMKNDFLTSSNMLFFTQNTLIF